MAKRATRAQIHATRPSDDPAETIERLLSRRQLKIETTDVVLTRTQGRDAIRRESFELRTVGDVGPPERFATFAHAAARGELMATERRARLFFIESEGQPPFLLKDARRV